MMLRETYQDENRPLGGPAVGAKSLSTGPPATATTASKPTSKWAARIVMAPIDCNSNGSESFHASQATYTASGAEVEGEVATAAPLPALLPPLPTAAVAAPNGLSSVRVRASTEELQQREAAAKEAMTLAGKACMDAWTAALEASRAYRAVRKEWRRANMKLEKRLAKHSPAEPLLALIDQPSLASDEAVAAADEEDALPAALAVGSQDLGQELDEVEQMEQAVHDVEQSEMQYAQLTHAETEDAEAEEGECEEQQEELEEEQEEGTEQDGHSTADPTLASSTKVPFDGVLSFHFGGKRGGVARRPVAVLSKQSKMSASDKARAAALKAKLEADMAAHEARRLALYDAQRVKQAEFERRRQAAKDKVEEQLLRRTAGRVDEAERKRIEAEARRSRQHEEEKRARALGKERKRKELEHTIEEMKAAKDRTAHSKKKQSAAPTTVRTR